MKSLATLPGSSSQFLLLWKLRFCCVLANWKPDHHRTESLDESDFLPEAEPAGPSVGAPTSPTPASKIDRILNKRVLLCLPSLSYQSCFTFCHPTTLSFICVRRKDLTSSVYSVHLERQIFHTTFEWGNGTIFQGNEQHQFWTDLLWERGRRNFYFLAGCWEVYSHYVKKVGFGSHTSLEPRWEKWGEAACSLPPGSRQAQPSPGSLQVVKRRE